MPAFGNSASGAGTYTEVYDPKVRHYDTTNWDPRNSYENLLDGSPDPNPPPPSGSEPPIAPPTVYPPNPYTGNSFLGWIAGQNGDGVDQVFNVADGFGDGASFGLSKVIRQKSGLFQDRADYDGNWYFAGDIASAFTPTPGSIAKQGTLVYKLYNKFGNNDYSYSPSPRFGKKGSGDEGLGSEKLEVRSMNYSEAELGLLTYRNEATSLLIPIEQVPLGSHIPTKNPKPWEYDDSLPDPVQADWAKISITMHRND